MSFKVNTFALRRYASVLGDVERVAEDADRYVAAYGHFGFREQGIIGYAAPGHRRLMADLHRLLTHLNDLGAESQNALRRAADEYERTDHRSAAAVDATYPAVPRDSTFAD